MADEDDFLKRRCSDDICNKARSEWMDSSIWPKIRIQIAVMISGTVIFMAGIFVYLSSNAIRDYDLAARDRYTTLTQHSQDLARIENKITTLEMSVSDHLMDVRKSLDRNLAAIQSLQGKR